MIRFRPTTAIRAAGALALGICLELGASTAHAQVAATPPAPAPAPAVRYYAPAPARVNSGGAYYGSNFYGPGAYYSPNVNGYNRGPVGPGPVRDWSTGRTVPLAKPWMRPLPR